MERIFLGKKETLDYERAGPDYVKKVHFRKKN